MSHKLRGINEVFKAARDGKATPGKGRIMLLGPDINLSGDSQDFAFALCQLCRYTKLTVMRAGYLTKTQHPESRMWRQI